MKNILFLCVANSARSQMAEGLARDILGDDVHVQSAGSQPTRVNPWAIEAMGEIGLSLDGHASTSVEDMDSHDVDVVITLCAEEVCPAFVSSARRYHWPIEDPDTDDTSVPDRDMLQRFRRARDEIARRIRQHVVELGV